jgi:hypothetical protein
MAGGSSVTVRVDGLRRLNRDLRKFAGDASDLKAANAAASATVATAASARAPRRSGRLAASVRGTKRVGGARVLAGGAVVPYAGPVHYGWPARDIDGQPFVIDAAQATEPVWLAAYAADLDRAAGRVAGGHY